MAASSNKSSKSLLLQGVGTHLSSTNNNSNKQNSFVTSSYGPVNKIGDAGNHSYGSVNNNNDTGNRDVRFDTMDSIDAYAEEEHDKQDRRLESMMSPSIHP